MKVLRTIILLSIAIILIHCSPPNHNDKSLATKESLLKTIEKFNTAFNTGDIKTLESMVTDNYLHTNSNSESIRKEDWFNYLHKRKKDIDSGILSVSSYNMDQTKVEIYNNTAIITARISVSSITSGKVKENQYRVTNIWVFQQGKWKRAGFHDGKIK
ncbi:nuclear transport factor 2 family protein [Aquimarina sp. MMG016]|uniref:nuclear transport factor 2 family protein n=1 Tax=Aquimarina sp. MMG016 TaxID=2822690 RepID=UPI001B39D7C8|nr:nuclear transport factor 2 family protein [Aquimarina sp. MMG016]MBQ4822437.1 nuclear transport factor 2 family protein [Aquimarina sp. MMG016]